jgi:hypothetical protein
VAAMINIKGIIIPVDWDAKGNVIGMAIATHKEEEYFIEDDGKAAKLISYLRQEVKITGVLKNRGNKKFIKIMRLSHKNAAL